MQSVHSFFVRSAIVAGTMLALTATLGAASVARQMEQIYQQNRVEGAALAPDGSRLAFAVHNGRGLDVLIWDLANPSGEAMRLRLDPRPGAQLSFFAWASKDRLIAVPNAPLVLGVDVGARKVTPVVDEKTLAAVVEKRRGGRPVIHVLRLQQAGAILTLDVRWPSTSGDPQVDVVTVDLRTGEHRLLQSKPLSAPDGALMADRQGRPRLLYDEVGGGHHFQYLYLPPDGNRRDWKPLDRVLQNDRSASFRVTPQNFLGERAIPLGFDEDPNVFYFASNVGRDTYGIHAVDLTTGKSVAFPDVGSRRLALADEPPKDSRWDALENLIASRTIAALEDDAVDLVDPNDVLPDSRLVFDDARGKLVGVRCGGGRPTTWWLDAELSDVQTTLEKKFPGRNVHIQMWDESRARFLVEIAAGHDPGRFFLFHRADGRCVEYVRQGGLSAEDANRVEPFALERSRAETLRGRITWPHAVAEAKPPLVVWLHDGPWEAVTTDFRRDAQALAAMGFAVLEVDHRGVSGFGRQHRDGMREGFDRVPLEDVLAALAWLDARNDVDRRRVAIAGVGLGGFLALRALQLHPDVFHCAAAINAPLDLDDLFRGDRERGRENNSDRREEDAKFLQAVGASDTLSGTDEGTGEISQPPSIAEQLPRGGGAPAESFEQARARWFFGPARRQSIAVTDHLDDLTQPVLLAQDPRAAFPSIKPARQMREALVRRRQVVELIELPPAFAAEDGDARSEVMRQIGEFLTVHAGDARGAAGGRP